MLEYNARPVHKFDNEKLPSIILFPKIKSARRAYFYECLYRNPKKYEWKENGDFQTPFDYLSELERIYNVPESQEGIIKPRTVGSLIVFPHVSTDVFWGGIDRETNLYKRLFRHVLNRADGIELVEIPSMDNPSLGSNCITNVGCPAEIVAYCKEAYDWSYSDSVSEYLFKDHLNPPMLLNAILESNIMVRNPEKLQQFFGSKKEMRKVFKRDQASDLILFIE